MKVVLMIALMIGAPIISEALWLGFASGRDAAICDKAFGRALNIEDTGHAVRVIGWFLSGMMAAFLLAMPFVEGAGS